jgi:hypothetical protein
MINILCIYPQVSPYVDWGKTMALGLFGRADLDK